MTEWQAARDRGRCAALRICQRMHFAMFLSVRGDCNDMFSAAENYVCDFWGTTKHNECARPLPAQNEWRATREIKTAINLHFKMLK